MQLNEKNEMMRNSNKKYVSESSEIYASFSALI